MTVPATRNPDIQKTKNQAGIYTTGEGERKTVTVDGKPVRIGPNSTLDTRTPQTNKFKQFIDLLTGNTQTPASGTTSVRGSVPVNPSKSYPGLASPVQTRQGLGTSTSAGGLSSQFQNFMNIMSGQYSSTGYSQQAMAPSSLSGIPLQSNNAVTASLVLGTNMPSYYQGPGQTGTGLGVSSQIGGYQRRNDPYAPFFNNQQLGLQPSQFSYAPQGQPNSYTPYQPAAPRQFSYSPQGQQNAPYGQIQPRPAPFLTSAMMANPTYGNAPQQGAVGPYTDPKAWYGRYAVGNNAYSGQAKTQQEAFQQGSIRVGKRDWIGRNRQDDGGAAAAALAAQQAAELAANQAITMNPGSVQQATWRPVY